MKPLAVNISEYVIFSQFHSCLVPNHLRNEIPQFACFTLHLPFINRALRNHLLFRSMREIKCVCVCATIISGGTLVVNTLYFMYATGMKRDSVFCWFICAFACAYKSERLLIVT